MPMANAQLTNLPDVNSATTTTGTTNTKGQTTTATTKGATTGTTGSTTGTATDTDTTDTAASVTKPTVLLSSSTSSSAASTAGTTGSIVHITGAPTIQGVGIPTLVVPYTANAPYMKKSNLPEGTVFITVGAVLAFLGFCVVGWRALVAWSINRSVKRAALASIMASETKNPGGWASNPFKPAGGFYSQAPGGSTLSLNDHSTTKRGAPFRNPVPSNASGLFFSPTANTSNATANIPMTGLNHNGNRASSLLPAGYYASPSSQVAGGAGQTSIGGGGQYLDSPSLQARRTSQQPMPSLSLAPPNSRESRRISARPTSSAHPQTLHAQSSANSLQVGTGHGDDLPGSRAPSAYLEDLFEGHGNPSIPPPQPHHR
ncbi:hypothetical protein K461DRAFT_287599 [Myriangium duriaei CBS 260.36]|uniref:Vacuolar membrane protein n=1 Tax=Myriangium duriaei CBS 260.36 TaxID=1168546 RepID=A0A9P4MEB9_9PEZI|nr:hypothetical protein K461DRAFT_287599 [Myriangium duriaei CBS 260.36]